MNALRVPFVVRSRRTAFRSAVLGACFALLIGVGAPSQPVPQDGGFPLPSQWPWSKGSPDVWSGKAFESLPKQAGGGAPGDPSQVDSAATRGARAAGAPAGKGIGALSPLERAERQTRQVTTPKAKGGQGAFNPATSKRIPRDSTATADVYANADGSYTRKLFDRPTNFKATDGTWTPIDRSLVQRADGRYVGRAGADDRDLAPGSTDPRLVTVRFGKRSISYGLQGAADVKALADGETLTYRGVQPGLDLVLTSNPQGVKEKLVLQRPDAGNSWVFPLELQGLTATVEPDGSVALRDGATVVATIPRGWMEDSKFNKKTGSFTHSDDVRYEIVTADGRPALKVTADERWLRDPARVYPVTVDPTVEAFGVTGDTFVSENDHIDHSGADYLNVGTGGTGERQNTFLQFANFEAAYAGVNISSATLNLHMYWSTMCEPSMVTAHQITAPWSVGGAKTYPGPAFDRDDIIGWAEPDPKFTCENYQNNKGLGVWVEVPIWNTVVNGWANGQPNYGLAVTADDQDNLQFKRFTSRDYSCCAPYLDITYSDNVRPQVDSQIPTSGHVSTTLTPTLGAHVTDPGGTGALTYNFLVFNAAGDKVGESGPLVGQNGWTVPSGVLRWGESYIWTVVASDAGGLSTTSQTFNSLSAPVPQPLLTTGLSGNDQRGYDPDTRNYTTTATDATVATVGPALTVQRQYNSLDPRTGSAFGAGWSSFLDMSATEVSITGRNGYDTVVVRYPNGQDLAFGRNGDGSYTPPPGRFATLTPVAGGGYRFTDKDGTVYLFSAASATPRTWRITSVTDASLRAMTFTYPSSTAPVSKVTAASGRALYFGWTTPAGATAAHITSVATDPVTPGTPTSAQTWTYGYTGDQLVKACPPTSTTACTTYSYGTTSVYAPTMLSAGPSGYWRLGESTGTGAGNAVLDYQGLYDGKYTDVTLGGTGPLQGSTAKAAQFNGTSSTVEILTPEGGVHAQRAVSLWFKAAPGDSGPLWSWGRESVVPGEAWYPWYHPGLYVGASGHLYGALYADGDYNPISSAGVVNDGGWHHAVLTAYDTGYAMYLDGNLVGTKLDRGQYDDTVGIQTIGGSFIGENWPDRPWEYDYTTGPWFFKGSIAEVAFSDRNLSTAQIGTLYTAGSRPTKVLTGIVRPSGGTGATVTYSPVDGAVTQVTDTNGGVWKIGAPAVVGGSQVYKKTIIDQRPGHYLRMQESGVTTAIDERPVSFQESTYSSVTLGTPGGPFDDATVAKFNGNSSYIEMADSARPTYYRPAQTTSMWFKMDAGSTTGGVLFGSQSDALANDPASGWVPWLYVDTGGKLRASYWTGGASGQIVTPGGVNDGQWHHVATIGDDDELTLFLDGAQVGAKVTAPMQFPDGNFTYVGAGKWAGWPGSDANRSVGYFPGSLAEFVMFPRTLTPADIQAQFAARAKSAGFRTRVSVVTDPTNKTLTYQYDSRSGRKTGEIDALGNRTTYGYDTAGHLRTTTDPNGNVTTNEHDIRGNTVSTTTCQDRVANKCSTVYYTYYPDATTRVLSPDPRNDVLLTVRDGRSASATDNTYLSQFTYDAKGNRTGARDPLGRQTTTVYTDGTTVAAQDGGFAPPGLPMTLTTAGGAIQRVVYFRNGDVAKVTDPAGKVTTFTYDVLGRVSSRTEVTDMFPAGLTTSVTYDRLDRPLTQTEPAVTNRVTGAVHTAVTSYTYNTDGQPLTQTVTDTTGGDAARTVSFTYDTRGRQRTATDPSGKSITFDYDLYGNVVLETDADGGQVRTGYDAAGRQLTTTLLGFTGDPNAPTASRDLLVTTRAYDPGGRLATVTDAMGWVTSYTYTDNNLPAKVIRKNPSTGAQFVQEDTGYDAAGNAVSQISGNGASRTDFVVDAAGRTTSTTLDPTGLKRKVTYGYSLDDHVTSTTLTAADGTVVGRSTAEYNPLGVLIAQTTDNTAGQPVIRTTYVVDQSGMVKSSTNPLGKTVDYTYDAAGRVTTNTGPAVQTEVGGGTPLSTRPISYAGYNTFGEQVERKDANGNIVVSTYDANGRLKTSTMPAYTAPGSTTAITPTVSRAYDALGQVTEETNVFGKKTGYVYDQLGRVAKVTEPGGRQTTFTYDLVGDQLTATDPTGAVNAATYDYLGRPVTASQVVRQDSTSYTTTFTYGTNGLLATKRSPAGVTQSATYNAAGETTTTTDGAGKVTTHSYDAAGRRTRTTLPDSTYTTAAFDLAGRSVGSAEYAAAGTLLASQSAAYDAAGQLTATTDARQTTQTYAYDAAGRLTSTTQPTGTNAADAITVSFGYDAAGNRTRFTDGRGNAFLTTYNPWSLPESSIEPSTSTHPALADRTFTLAYDDAARPKKLLAPGGVSATNDYDDAGNLITQSGAGADASTVTRQFGYDLAGRLTGVTAPGGTDAFTYDDRGMLRTTSGPSGASTFTYRPDGQPASRADAAGTTGYTYDTAGRLSVVDNPTSGVKLTVGYNNLSMVTSVAYGASGNTRTLGYDGRHRLTSDELKTSAGATVARIQYGWDANGNEVSKTTSGFTGSGTNTYTYDLADRLVTWNNGVVTTGYTYDKSGNRTANGSRTFSYDQRNRLTGSSDGTAYAYTPRGTLATTTKSGVAQTTTDAFGQVITQQAGAATTTYTYDGLGRAHRPGFAYSGAGNTLAADGTATYTRGPSDELLGVAVGGTKTTAWTDLHDDVVALFTAAGTTLSGSTAYDPLGRALSKQGTQSNLGYQSGWTEQSTGRVNMAARWYNTDTGQFDTRDTVEVGGVPNSIRANKYAYGDGNPLTVTDPTGHFGLSDLANGVRQVYNTVKDAVVGAIDWVVEKVQNFADDVRQTYDNTRAAYDDARRRVDEGRKWVAEKYNEARRAAQEKYDQAKQAGERAAAAAAKASQKAVNSVRDAYEDAEKWAKDHKDLLIEVAAIAGAVLAGLACGLITFGVGAVACMIGAGALINLAKDAAQGNIKNWGDAFGSMGTGAVTGLAGAFGGMVGAKVAGALASKLGGALIGRVATGAIAGGAGDAVAQFVTTGHVDWTGVAMGAVFGGITGGRAKRPAGGAHAGGAPPAGRPSTGRPSGGGHSEPNVNAGAASRPPSTRAPRGTGESNPTCRTAGQSFTPETRVLMADGSTKAIGEIAVGDQVVATDPETGKTSSEPVVALYNNQDAELTDVTLRSEDGSTATVHATPHHPFWNATRQEWTDAGDLQLGDQVLDANGRTTQTVAAIKTWTGLQWMRDLTVANAHTFYVLAGEQPVLVHNVDGIPCVDVPALGAGIPTRSQASVGSTTDHNYRETFFAANPGLRGNVVVHHAIEQQVLSRYPGLFSPNEIHSLENLRGVPKGIVNNRAHLSKIRLMWNGFYNANTTPTRQNVLDFATHVDDTVGNFFLPRRR